MEDILDDMIDDTGLSAPQYTEADKGTRLGNYVIDTIAYYIMSIVLGVFMFMANDLVEPDTGLDVFNMIASIAMVLLYYTAMEAIFDGKTIGKFITGTRAVRIDGQPMDAGTAFKRSLSRLVPFEPFSFLGSTPRGWHDRWTDTMVVSERKR